MSENELGAFLRVRREAIGPGAVGLPVGARRRAPGLRRAEVATLAGVSVDYLTRLEQGRDRHPSPQILSALADALRFTREDRQHLRVLVFRNKDTGPCPAADDAPGREVTATVRAVVDRLDPAVVVNRIGDVLAYGHAFDRLARPLGLLDGDPPNMLRYLFTDPRARQAMTDWDRIADHQVASLKADSHRTDPHIGHLADELTITGGGPFSDRYRAITPLPVRSGVERWRHPDAGELAMAFETLTFADAELRVITYLPADDRTGAALARLTAGPVTALRLVT